MADNNTILEKLEGLVARFEEVSTLITDPAVIADQKRYVKLTKEYKELGDLMNARKEYMQVLGGIEEAKEIIANETDQEMREMAREELDACQARQPELEEQIVFKESDYFEKLDEEYGNKTEWIIPNAQKNIMEPIRLTLAPGGSTYPDNPHEGEEFGYILSGSITIHIGKKSYRAKKGESFYFTPKSTHYISASKKTGASLIWVSSPPSF